MCPSGAPSPVKQITIKNPFSLEGIALHSGKSCRATVKPVDPGTGIVFVFENLIVRALAENVASTERGVNLGGILVVEHFLAAAAGLGIDNLEVVLTHPELPNLDGSALPYMEALISSGLSEQAALKEPILVASPILIEAEGASLCLSPYNGFKVDFMIDFPVIGKQQFSYAGDFASIAPARTFGFLSEIEDLYKRGLARGASLENALGIGPDGYLNPPRFPDEPVRHKVLDLIGDLALAGRPLKGALKAERSGHKLNIELARRLRNLC